MTTYGQMYRFDISCNENYTRQYQLLASSLASNTRTYALTDLQPGAHYECCVWAVNNAGSNRACIGIETLESGAGDNCFVLMYFNVCTLCRRQLFCVDVFQCMYTFNGLF